MNFANLDLLISSIYRYQSGGNIGVPSQFGPRFKTLNVFYSSPEYYTKWKHMESMRLPSETSNGKGDMNSAVQWSVKTDDFFPYSECPHCFWTGYFTSRTSFKRLERVGSSFLQAARQIESMKDSQNSLGFDDCHCRDALYPLDDAMGIVQHHDAVSGTAKQHVANDYSKRVQIGIDRAANAVAEKFKRLLLTESDAGQHLKDLAFCQLLNETKCDVSTQADGKDLYVIVYNGLARKRSTIIALPIPSSVFDESPHVSVVVQRPHGGEFFEGSIHLCGDSAVLYINTGLLPPVGGSVFRVSFVDDTVELGSQDRGDAAASLKRRSMLKQHHGSDVAIHHSGDTADVSNGILSVRFDR